jgi:hypothetical protein
MSSITDQLLDLYCSGPIERVHASEAYQNLYALHEGERTFYVERNKFEELRIQVDRFLQSTGSHREQVEFALRLLRRLDTPDKKEIGRKLILGSYALLWPPPLKTFFEDKSAVIMNAKDYFLSFTNRNPNNPHQNEINIRHKFFIRDSLGEKSYDRANLSTQNLLAETVRYHLKKRHYDGFYYPEHEGDNTIVKEKLTKNCLNALAFVQLVQAAMFRDNSPSPNWCFFEYDLASKNNPDGILFIKVEDNIREPGVHLGFSEWYEFYTENDALLLEPTARWNSAKIDNNISAIEEKLASQIDRSINRIYLSIP